MLNFKKFTSGLAAMAVAATAFVSVPMSAGADVVDFNDSSLGGYYSNSVFTWTVNGPADTSGLTSKAYHKSYTKKIYANENDNTSDNVELKFVPNRSYRNTNNSYNKWDGLIDGGIHIVADSGMGDISERYLEITPSVDGAFVFDTTATRINGTRNDYYVYLYVNDITNSDTISVTKDNLLCSIAPNSNSVSKNNSYYLMEAGHKYVITRIGGSNNSVVTLSNLRYVPKADINATIDGVGIVKTFSSPLIDGTVVHDYPAYVCYNNRWYRTSESGYVKTSTDTASQTASYAIDKNVAYFVEIGEDGNNAAMSGGTTFQKQSSGFDEYKINVPITGKYNINIVYFQTKSRSMNVGLDGNATANTDSSYIGLIPAGNDKTTPDTLVIENIDLTAGDHTLYFNVNYNLGSRLDYIYITANTYTVNTSSNNVELTISEDEKAIPGTEIQLSAVANPGYNNPTISVIDADNNIVPVSDGKFIMPAKNVTVLASAEALPQHTIQKVESGAKVTIDKELTYEGDTVTLSNLTADENYINPTVTVTYVDGNSETQTVAVTNNQFVMPAYPVTVTASAEEIGQSVNSITVQYKFGDTLIKSESIDATGKTVGETATIPFRMYVEKDGKLYQTAANSGNPNYGDSVTLTANTVLIKQVNEVNLGGTLVVFDDLDGSTGGNADIRASNCSSYANSEYTSESTLSPGVYTFIFRAMKWDTRNSSIYVGDTKVCSIDDIGTSRNWSNKTISNVTIPTAGKINIRKGTAIDYYDIIIAIKTGDIVNAAVDTATGRDHSIATSYSTDNLAAVSGNIITWKIDVPEGAKLKLNNGVTTFDGNIGAADSNGHSTVITPFSLGVKCSTPTITGGKVSIGLIVDGLYAPGSSAVIAAVSSSDYIEAGEYIAPDATGSEFNETAELWGVDYMLTMMYSDDELMEITGDIASDDEGSASDINDFIDMSDENLDSEAVGEME